LKLTHKILFQKLFSDGKAGTSVVERHTREKRLSSITRFGRGFALPNRTGFDSADNFSRNDLVTIQLENAF